MFFPGQSPFYVDLLQHSPHLSPKSNVWQFPGILALAASFGVQGIWSTPAWTFSVRLLSGSSLMKWSAVFSTERLSQKRSFEWPLRTQITPTKLTARNRKKHQKPTTCCPQNPVCSPPPYPKKTRKASKNAKHHGSKAFRWSRHSSLLTRAAESRLIFFSAAFRPARSGRKTEAST